SATMTDESIPGASSIKGTFGYMAPEQLLGRAADARSDLFSFGVIVYELLAGNPAFPGATGIERGYATLHQTPPPLPASVPDPLRRIVARCLAKDPARRFQSADDLLFILDGLSARKSGARFNPRSLRLAAAGLALLAATVALLMLWRGQRAAPRPTFDQI